MLYCIRYISLDKTFSVLSPGLCIALAQTKYQGSVSKLREIQFLKINLKILVETLSRDRERQKYR